MGKAHVRLLKFRPNPLALTAFRNRQELIRAGLHGRRDLLKLGLLSSAGYLVATKGLSSRAEATPALASPRTTPFVWPLRIMPVKTPVGRLDPMPTVKPNLTPLPDGRPTEGRTRDHQALNRPGLRPRKLYLVTQKVVEGVDPHDGLPLNKVSPDLPEQTMWGFDGMVPGPTYHANFGFPILVRNRNELPLDNGGFGKNEVSTHLHNFHTPSESDGFPCDFFGPKQFYDHHYPAATPGLEAFCPSESRSTLWYHDHRISFTAQNVYKGLAGFFLVFDGFCAEEGRFMDDGDETKGLRLPGVWAPDQPGGRAFDVPLLLADRVFDPTTGLLAFDLFNLDGILGDKFLVNGRIQPFLEVHPRRYRFRILNTGPSRFYQLFLTDLNDPGRVIPFWQISNDGNLLPKPIPVQSVRLGVAERHDIIVDFAQFLAPRTRHIVLENRLEQKTGRGPTDKILPAGQGDHLLRFDVVLPPVGDNSRDPAEISVLFPAPLRPPPVLTRTFEFNRTNGQWAINNKLIDDNCDEVRFRVRQSTPQEPHVERWFLVNGGGGWSHPVHIHFEEFEILSRNGKPEPLGQPLSAGGVPISEQLVPKDVVRLGPGERIELVIQFRDFLGRHPIHCHNVVHEDHAMMLRFDIDPEGDRNPRP